MTASTRDLRPGALPDAESARAARDTEALTGNDAGNDAGNAPMLAVDKRFGYESCATETDCTKKLTKRRTKELETA
ncbi:hypothetical protein ACIPYQ_35230 [Streptomyces sp. NPDC090045]|uniref:hypothetical protein n=1 Tax=Streptomyces sp. NPDC090045 TaxID=3365927 RepID=UPI00382E5A8E